MNTGTIQRAEVSNTCDSRFFIFQNNSNQVKIRSRNHTGSCWRIIPEDGSSIDADGTADGYFTYNLSHTFIISGEPSPPASEDDTENFGISLPIDYTTTPTPPSHEYSIQSFGISLSINYSSDDNGSGFIISDSAIPYYVVAGLAVFFPLLGLIIYKKG